MTTIDVIGYGDHMPRPYLPRLTDERLRELAAAYGTGMSIRELAFDRQMSYGAMHRRLVIAQERGLTTIRSRGGQAGARASGDAGSDHALTQDD